MEEAPKSEAPRHLVDRYKEQAETLLKQYGKDFDRFTENLEDLIEEGDNLLLNEEVTGYNILLSREDMDLASEGSLIFYSNYIGKPEHFAELIAEMIHEGEGIVDETQIRLGKKASKTEFTGKWKIDPEHEKLDWVEGKDETGKIQKKRVSKTVETVVIFAPKDDGQANLIADKLDEKVGWAYPDIRATISLRDALSKQNFQEVVANIRGLDKAQLIALHEYQKFDRPYDPESIMANPDLVTFIATSKPPPS